MKKITLLVMLFIALGFNAMSQCENISLIGEFNGWSGDHFLFQDSENPNFWTTTISFSKEMNLEGPSNIIEMKFRQNADWTINWGNNEFPGGFAFQDGPNIPVLIDTNAFENTFYVTFDCSTGEYHFYSQSISLIGEFTNWSGDHFLSQDSENPNIWRTILKLTPAMNSYDPADIVEMKFRKGADWTVNWGATEFPGGIGMPFGPNIPVPVMMDAPFTVYEVTFNSQTGAYNFVQVSAKMVPVSNWALMIGGLLIVAVAVLRFRRII